MLVVLVVVVREVLVGKGTSRSGLEKREARWAACCEVALVEGRFWGGRGRGAWDWGMDSGIGSDIFFWGGGGGGRLGGYVVVVVVMVVEVRKWVGWDGLSYTVIYPSSAL